MRKTRRREKPTVRKEQILHAAIELASKVGYQVILRDEIAAIIGASPALISFHFATMEQLRSEVMRAAIEREILPIIAQGLSIGDKQTQNLKPELRQKVISFFT